MTLWLEIFGQGIVGTANTLIRVFVFKGVKSSKFLFFDDLNPEYYLSVCTQKWNRLRFKSRKNKGQKTSRFSWIVAMRSSVKLPP